MRLIEKLQLPNDFIELVRHIYVPLAAALQQKISHQPLLVSINGAQGTGKTTLAKFVKLLLETQYQLSSVVLSLDDFYLHRQQREQLAATIHPLFITRGVPGTHNLPLLEQTIEALLAGQPCLIPRFNKATDNPFSKSAWLSCQQRADVILFEGWCNNSPVMTAEQLYEPVNELEASEDKQGVWRSYSNEQLKQYHHRVYDRTDLLLMLKAPDFKNVFTWRQQQEAKLRIQSHNKTSTHIMNSKELHRFIMHFERITRHCLQQLPEQADFVLPLTSSHGIRDIIQA